MWLRDLLQFSSRQRKDLTSQMDPLTTLHREINSLFERAIGRLPSFELENEGINIDIIDGDRELIIKGDIPGVSEDDITLRISNNILFLHVEKKEESKVERKNYYMMERSYGRFNRFIPIPFAINPESIDAEIDKGVLTIRIPKLQEALETAKEIKIKKK